MIRETKVIIFLLLFSFTNCFSQQLSNQVLVPAAGTATAGVISYSQSVGEVAVEFLSGPDIVLTQGFQQPQFKIIDDPVTHGNGVNVYPSPVTDYLYVRLWGTGPRKFRVELINLTGVILQTKTLDFNSTYNYTFSIEASRLKFGLYFVRVVSTDKLINRVFKIEKM